MSNRLLLVEDDELIQDILRRRLTRAGYEVTLASDGEEAIAIARRDHPELILLDMGLPVLDGWQTATQLKASPDTRAIPVIALTAYAIAGDRERALACGCDEYESKPVSFPRLLEKIQMLLASGSTASQGASDEVA